MGRYGVVVIGPAGSGKSTFCLTMQNHIAALSHRLPARLVNLDPGQERSEEQEKKYPFDLDVRELISVPDVLEELAFGPNGALVFCMEHLVENIDWLEQGLQDLGPSDDEYFIFDCPGQIELYTHIPVLTTVVEKLMSWNINVCVVHVIDALFIDDTSKYISGALLSLTSMMQLKAPAVNVITKCDIKKRSVEGGRKKKVRGHIGPEMLMSFLDYSEDMTETAKEALAEEETEADKAAFAKLDAQDKAREEEQREEEEEDESEYLGVDDPEYFNPDPLSLRAAVQEQAVSDRFKSLSESICTVLENYNLVHFVPLDITDEESLEFALSHIDAATQYGEDLEPRDPGENEVDEEEEEEDS